MLIFPHIYVNAPKYINSNTVEIHMRIAHDVDNLYFSSSPCGRRTQQKIDTIIHIALTITSPYASFVDSSIICDFAEIS